MINPNLISFNLSNTAKKLARRKCIIDTKMLYKQNNYRKILQIETENLQAQHNKESKVMHIAKLHGKDTKLIYEKIVSLKNRLHILKRKLNTVKNIINRYLLSLPNIPDNNVPEGFNENDNIEILRWGEPRKYNFVIRDHIELGKLIGEIDFSTAAKITGSNFTLMHGQIAYLHRALIQFMLDLHIKEHEYKEYYLPYLVNNSSLYNSGHLPKFTQDLFYIKLNNKDTSNYALIPTAEVPLINIIRNKIVNEDILPIKMVAHTPCFRSEAGSYGRKTRGLIRMHQFDKVEMVQIVKPENSMQALEEMTKHAEKVLQLLNLPYRKMLLCTGNMGFSSCKTYDLEVYLPSENFYQEISSCSNVSDFQSRRMKARYKNKQNKKIRLLHTLNGSGLAISRTLAAVLENYQLEDGRIKVPDILQTYMKNLIYIG